MSLLESSLWSVEEDGLGDVRLVEGEGSWKAGANTHYDLPFVKPSLGSPHPAIFVSAGSSWALRRGGSRTHRKIQRNGERRKDGMQVPGPTAAARLRLPRTFKPGCLGRRHRNWPQASSPGKRCNLGVGRFPCEGCCFPSGSRSLLLSNVQAAICP